MELSQNSHAAHHIFTGRPDLCMRSAIRGFSNKEKRYREFHSEGETPAHDPDEACFFLPHYRGEKAMPIVIQYPHAFSEFEEQDDFAADYLAATLSRQKKSPVLLAGYTYHPEAPWEYEYLWLTFGADGKYVGKIGTRIDHGRLEVLEVTDLNKLKTGLSSLFPDPNFWDDLMSDPRPQVMIEKLNRALGIFVCGQGLYQFLESHCVLKRQMMFGSVYQAKENCVGN